MVDISPRSKPLLASDMDVVGDLWAIRFVKDVDRIVVELYSEDDDWYYLVDRVSPVWLRDLADVATRAHHKWRKT